VQEPAVQLPVPLKGKKKRTARGTHNPAAWNGQETPREVPRNHWFTAGRFALEQLSPGLSLARTRPLEKRIANAPGFQTIPVSCQRVQGEVCCSLGATRPVQFHHSLESPDLGRP